MKKKYLFIILFLIIILLVGLYLVEFQKEFLRQTRDSLITASTHLKVVNSNKYKKFNATDKSKKYYKTEKEIKIPILLYHQICNDKPKRQDYHLSTTTEQFKKQIYNLKNLGYTFITYEDLIAYHNNELALPEFCVLISFDDGYKNVYENAYPTAKELNIPITIFVIDSCVGTRNYISWNDAREMDNSGLVSIYTHCRNHIDYSKMPSSTLLDDVNFAHVHIEKELGHSIAKVMAYPYGGYTNNEIELLSDNGFVQNILLDTPNNSNSLNLATLSRIFVKQNYSVYTILNIIL